MDISLGARTVSSLEELGLPGVAVPCTLCRDGELRTSLSIAVVVKPDGRVLDNFGIG